MLFPTLLAAVKKNIVITPGTGSGFESLNFEPASLVTALITLALVISALVAFTFLVIGGIKWITAGGDKAKTEGARGTITAALVGLAIVFSAWAILKIIETFFNLTLTTLVLPGITK